VTEQVHLFGPQELYRHWEESQWSPFEIDLAADAEQWGALGGEDRGLIFDVALVEAHGRLAANPSDPEAKVRFPTLYHQIFEGTLGFTSYNFGLARRRLAVIGVPLSTL
jgi:hypothetical protein